MVKDRLLLSCCYVRTLTKDGLTGLYLNVGSVYGSASVMAARSNIPTGSKPNVRLADYQPGAKF